MKFINKFPFLLVLVLLISASCEEEEDRHVYAGPMMAHFASPTTTTTNYFVRQSSDPGFVIPVGVTGVADQDRTYQVEVVTDKTTAEAGVHYTVPATVTIPAGQSVANLVVTGNFDNLTSPETLTLRLSDGQDNAGFNQTTALTLRQFCPYEQSNFIGMYRFTSPLFEDSWDVELVAGANANEVIAKSLYEDGVDVKIVLDATNPASFVATVPEQHAWTSGLYGQAKVRTVTAGKFSACENTINVTLRHCVSAGCFTPDDAVTFSKL